jgi:hypothetical protein
LRDPREELRAAHENSGFPANVGHPGKLVRILATRLGFHRRPQAGDGPLNRKRPAQMVNRFSHRGTPRGLEVAVKGEVLQEAEGLHFVVIFYGLKEI